MYNEITYQYIKESDIMSKSVTPIVLKDTDAIFLESILSGQTAAGNDILKRAKALLLLSEGKQVKETAKEIGMRENSVTEIRRRFLANGINSLMDKSRTGRPATKLSPEDVDIKVGDVISSAFASGMPIPSVKELAASLNANAKDIRESLKKRGVIQSRTSIWEFPVCEGPDAKAMDLIGMYLSSDQQFIFVRILTPTTFTDDEKSLVLTKNSFLASKLSATVSDEGFIDLVQALEVFISGSESRPLGKEHALAFIKDIYNNYHSGSPGEEYHLFIHGKSLANNNRSLLPGISIHVEPDSKTWLSQVESFFQMLCKADSNISQRLTAGINAYLQRSSVDKAVFEWKKTKSPRADIAATEITCEQKKISSEPGTIVFEARILADDGHWITYTARGSSSVKQEQFDMSSANAYLNSFDTVEQAIVSVSRDAARGINEAYAADQQHYQK